MDVSQKNIKHFELLVSLCKLNDFVENFVENFEKNDIKLLITILCVSLLVFAKKEITIL